MQEDESKQSDASLRSEFADWQVAFSKSGHPLAKCLGAYVAASQLTEADRTFAELSGEAWYLFSRSTHEFLRDAAVFGLSEPNFEEAGLTRIVGIDSLVSCLMNRLSGRASGSYEFERGLENTSVDRTPPVIAKSSDGASQSSNQGRDEKVALTPEAVEALALSAYLTRGDRSTSASVNLDVFVFALLVSAGKYAGLLDRSLDPLGGALDADGFRKDVVNDLLLAADGKEVAERTGKRSSDLQKWITETKGADWPPLPRPVEAPDYRADRPISRPQDDLLGFRAEARAAAEMMCMRESGALTIGVFGDWGSGKSSFLRLLESEVESLTQAVRESPQEKDEASSPFLQKVETVHFDVWQYNDTHLMLALANRTFAKLRGDDFQIEFAKELEAALPDLSQKSAEMIKKLDANRRKKDETQASIEKAHTDAKDEQEKALTAAFNEFGMIFGSEVQENDSEAKRFSKELLKKAQASPSKIRSLASLADLRLLRKAPKRVWLLALLLTAIGLASWIYNLMPQPAAMITFLAGLVPVVNYAHNLAGILANYTQSVAKTDQKRDVDLAELERNNEELDDEIELTEQELQRITVQLDRFGAAGPDQHYDFFLSESTLVQGLEEKSGLTAKVRVAFDTLDRMISKKRDETITPEGAYAKLPDKIVFYIDELDRCRGEQVVRMLEAIHLLLAFRNFAVVVAVDSRWLEGALLSVFERELKTSGNRTAIVHEYIEKIIQVPIRVPGLSLPQAESEAEPSGSYVDMIRSLAPAETTEAVVANGTVVNEPGGGGDGVASVASITPLNIRPAVVSADPRAAARRAILTEPEVRGLATMGRFVGTSPRTVKRFVNLYRLFRAVQTGEDFEAFVNATPDAPALFEPVQLCLAIQCGLTKEAVQSFRKGVAIGMVNEETDIQKDFADFLCNWANDVEGQNAAAQTLKNAVAAAQYRGLWNALRRTERYAFWPHESQSATNPAEAQDVESTK